MENNTALATPWPVDTKPVKSVASKKVKLRTKTRPQLLSRQSLDARTNAAKAFDRLASAIEADLGGRDQCSTIQLALIEAFCGSAITLDALNAKLALGLPVDVSQHSQCVGAMVRVASRLGLHRVAKPVPDLHQYLQSLKDQTTNDGDDAEQLDEEVSS